MKNKLAILAIICALPLLVAMAERRHGEARGPAVGVSFNYVYYPDAEVYYEPQHRVYYWNDGGAWRSGPRAPQNYVLRSSVRINLDSPEPYRHHDEVRAKYPHQKQEDHREHQHQDHDQK
jgi:hypothetical protein